MIRARRRSWGRHASLAAVALGAIGGFSAIARAVRRGGTEGNAFDRAVVHTFGRARSPVSNVIVRALTSFGGVLGGIGVSSAALYVARKSPRLASQLVTGAVGGLTAELLVKRFFRRERPTLLAHLEDVRSTSFPSGHAMAAACIYLTVAFVGSHSRRLHGHRAALLAGAATFATSIGASRVFLGVHWPTDVLGGLALGTAWACATEAVFDLDVLMP
jgi:undecaprenyl-diphosphatase